MSVTLAENITIIVDGYDLSCAFKEMKSGRKTDELDTTALCTTGNKTFAPGLKEGTLNLTGMYEYDGTNLNKIENVLQTAFANQSNIIVTGTLGAIASGGVALMCTGGQVKHDVDSVLNQLIMSSADIHAAGNVYSGQVLFSGDVNNTSVVGVAVDFGSQTTNGGVLHFHAFNNGTGFTDGSIVVQHGANTTSMSTLIPSTAIGANHGAIAIALAPGTTVKRYLKVTVTATGGSASFVAAFYKPA